jgi:hypothetical protein
MSVKMKEMYQFLYLEEQPPLMTDSGYSYTKLSPMKSKSVSGGLPLLLLNKIEKKNTE